jgi:hypothetical protein
MPGAESEVVATPAGLALPADALVAAAAEGLIEQAKATGVALTGEGGLLTGLVGRVLQRGWSLRSPIISAMNAMPWRGAGRATPGTATIPRPCAPRSATSR